MSTDLAKTYTRLMAKYRDLSIFSSAQDVLSWDMMTNLPPRGIKLRSHQLALLSGIAHRMAASPEIGRLLARIERDSSFQELAPLAKRNVRLMRKTYDEQVAIPESLTSEIERQNAISYFVWRGAKHANDWKAFLPELEKNVALAKRKAAILMNVKKTPLPYDALIDVFESGMTSDRIGCLFDNLLTGLGMLIDKIVDSQNQCDSGILGCKIPLHLQRAIAATLAEAVSYDVISSHAGGRIDETEHPFTSGCYDDVRITTHYYEGDFTSSVFSILHEAGHALYEQGLNPEWMHLPAGTACSTGIHESQSRFLENIVGRSPQFWAYFLPRLKKMTGSLLSGIDLKEFVQAINQVKSSKIRIEADEVTYSIHGIIRFNIERELFADRIAVKELPEAWNESYRRYLGVEIKDYAEGIMQDVHWADGSFGYFPCYVLGNIYDGHLLAKMDLDVPEWPSELEKGNLLPTTDWMTRNVHRLGNLYDAADLIKRVTGDGLSAGPYLKYLTEKYTRIGSL